MDREELLQLFPAHRERLVASLVRLVGSDDAQDIANETLLRALASVDGFRGDAAVGTWLHRICVNLAYDLLRRRSSGPVLPEAYGLGVPEVATDDFASEILERRQTAKCVQHLLKQLPPKHRQVLVKADMFDWTAPEIAQEAGITPGNAKIRLHRARYAMRVALETHCDFHHWEDGTLCCTPKSKG